MLGRPNEHARPVVHCAAAESTVLLVTEHPRIGMLQLRQAHEALRALGVRRLQLISRHNITTQTMNLNHSLPTDHTVTVLPWALILMYPLDHELVPRHRRATPEERARLGPASQLPTLRADDVIARYLSLDPGDVVHIARPDGTVYWRLIV